ncbi:MAG TPA: hypothetical protein ENG33_01465 [Chloroflexi bacterium]|nr:hypothetical protein [Chloroflexota bacterium]
MKDNDLDITTYGTTHIESFLANYEMLVKDLPDLAAEWPRLNEQERNHHLAVFIQAWGARYVLGKLFKARKLTATQEKRLEELDRLLLENSSLMRKCYGLELKDIVKIFIWGTPLSKSKEEIRMEITPASLTEVAMALVAVRSSG